MRLIEELPGVDLAVCEVSSKSLWIAPNMMIDENGQYVELSISAADKISADAGLNTAVAAGTLFSINRPKWELFQNVFDSYLYGSGEYICLSNKAMTKVHSFLGNNWISDIENLKEMYEKFSERGVETEVHQMIIRDKYIMDVSVSIEKVEDSSVNKVYDCYIVVVFNPVTKSVCAFTLRTDLSGDVYISKLYDAPINTPKKRFSINDIDWSIISYDVVNPMVGEHETSDQFKYSLKEFILYLRTILQVKQIPVDLDAFLLSLRTKNEPQAVDELGTKMYNHINEYYFYYDNKATLVVDDELIQDKLRGAKAQLYFLARISYQDIKELLNFLVLREFEEVRHVTSRPNGDHFIDYFLELVAYHVWATNYSKFDAYKIPYYWTGNT